MSGPSRLPPSSALYNLGRQPMSKPIFVLNGPNLNMLGVREPAVYGSETLEDVRRRAETRAQALGLTIDFRQSNMEGELVTWIQEARDKADGIILNAGAYTHTSVAILDALSAAEKPVIELHLSNVFRRESFRHHSYVAPAAQGVICGFGPKGYELALEAMAGLLDKGSSGRQTGQGLNERGWDRRSGWRRTTRQERSRAGPDPRARRPAR